MNPRIETAESPQQPGLAWHRSPAPYLALRALVLSQAAAQGTGAAAAWRSGHKTASSGMVAGRDPPGTVTGAAA